MPRSYTSLRGSKLCFVAASAPEAVASTKASAKVVLVNIVMSPVEFIAHTVQVRVRILLEPGGPGKSARRMPVPARGSAQPGESACLQTAFLSGAAAGTGMLLSWE